MNQPLLDGYAKALGAVELVALRKTIDRLKAEVSVPSSLLPPLAKALTNILEERVWSSRDILGAVDRHSTHEAEEIGVELIDLIARAGPDLSAAEPALQEATQHRLFVEQALSVLEKSCRPANEQKE